MNNTALMRNPILVNNLYQRILNLRVFKIVLSPLKEKKKKENKNKQKKKQKWRFIIGSIFGKKRKKLI